MSMDEEVGEQVPDTFAVRFPAMPATEVFLNANGGVTITQNDDAGYPQGIVFPVEMAQHVVNAILDAVEAGTRAPEE